MDTKVVELMKSIPKDKVEGLIKLASKAESADAIMELAKNAGIEITGEQAEGVLKAFSEKVAVSDDDLDKVSGGDACAC